MENNMLIPIEILREIIQHTDAKTYRTMLVAVPELYRNMTPIMKIDLLILSGVDVHVEHSLYTEHIQWTLGRIPHNPYGPAIQHSNGDVEYQINGKYRRIDGGPTRITNGYQYWNNECMELHNMNGPAVIYPDGSKRWYICGMHIHTESEYLVARDQFAKILRGKRR